jgi:hypothetical protein
MGKHNLNNLRTVAHSEIIFWVFLRVLVAVAYLGFYFVEVWECVDAEAPAGVSRCSGRFPHYEPKLSPVSMVSKFLDFVQMSY